MLIDNYGERRKVVRYIWDQVKNGNIDPSELEICSWYFKTPSPNPQMMQEVYSWLKPLRQVMQHEFRQFIPLLGGSHYEDYHRGGGVMASNHDMPPRDEDEATRSLPGPRNPAFGLYFGIRNTLNHIMVVAKHRCGAISGGITRNIVVHISQAHKAQHLPEDAVLHVLQTHMNKLDNNCSLTIPTSQGTFVITKKP